MSVIALIPAAGFGTRFHEGGPKALVMLRGKPLVLHAVERLHASGRVDRAVVSAPLEHEAEFVAALAGSPLPVKVVAGGVTRRASVANALAASDAADSDLLCVHDAARPLVDPLEVGAVVDAAAQSGAAIAGFSPIETIKKIKNGKVHATVPRDDLLAATTPQVFRGDILRAAIAKESKRSVTDDAELVERSGVTVTVVLTSRWNIKITYPEDLAWAEAWLNRPADGG